MRTCKKSRDIGNALPPLTAPSKRKLAEKLGYSRQAVCQWARLPGAPKPMVDGSENVDAWRAFVRARGLGLGSLAKSPERVAEITRRHRLAADRMKADLDARRAQYVLRAEAAAKVGFAADEAERIFRRRLAGIAGAGEAIRLALAELREVVAGYG